MKHIQWLVIIFLVLTGCDQTDVTPTAVTVMEMQQETISPVITSEPSPTPPATITPTPTTTAVPATVQPTPEARLFYVVTDSNLRECADTSRSCPVVATVRGGTELGVIGVEQGESLLGNTLWYKVSHGNDIVYIHSSLIRD